MKKIILQNEPIDMAQMLHEVESDSDGAVVSFVGKVRKNSRGKNVLHLEYEAYREMARKELAKAADEAEEKWGISNCLVAHRFGRIEVGEASIIIAVSSPHRHEAFLAAQYLIDTVKKKVPIWKKEYYSDGSSWINDKE
ncbi:MAG: molybdenum cofactor biosynthesis protein MoaE [Spirochaetes bacterium RBG_16_49_21]|nr:MAG: molybdenum cofactor biosynthesis protein MoaE [Spirochaetes bacterium RBG_16_49_21]